MSQGGRERAGRWVRIWTAVYSLVLALVIVGPLLGPGYLLLRDAVSTPRSYPTDSALGLGDAAPRAVPQDALLAAVSTVVDGGVVVRIILVLALWAAGWGAAVLARELLRVSLGPQLVAATVGVWNPYVAERLLQGHWSLLAGYAALPWTVLVANRIRQASHANTARPGPRSHETRPYTAVKCQRHNVICRSSALWAVLGGCLAAAGLTPTGGILAGCVALLVIGRRNLLGLLMLWLIASAPWLVAALVSGAGAEPSDPAGVAAFAARAEPGLGTLGSVAGLGGIWNRDAVPGSRTTLFALVGTVVLLAMVIAGMRRVAMGRDPSTRHARRALLILAGVAIVLPTLGATAWGLSAGEFLVARVPGAGLLRDTQKYVALAMPAFALCAAAGCQVVATAVRRRASPDRAAGIPLTATLFIALLFATLADLAWGVGDSLRSVHYPVAWQRVAARVDGPGDIAVLPGGMFREFPYSGSVPVLDPAPRMLPRDVLQTGELPVRGRTVAGEGSRALEVEHLLLRGATPDHLAARGVGWILVEHTTPGPLGNSKDTLAHLNSVYSDADLTLYRIPNPDDLHTSSHATDRGIVIAAHIAWALLLAAALPAAWFARRR